MNIIEEVMQESNSVKSGAQKQVFKPGVKPTLVLGLGGTGCRILRQLKRHLRDSDKDKAEATYIEMIGIDSDSTENEKYPFLPALELNNELLLYVHTIAVNNLIAAAAGDRDYKSILDYLPDESGALKGLHSFVRERIGTGRGAGQFRRAGKLLFRSNVTSGLRLKSRLEEKRKVLTSLSKSWKDSQKGRADEQGVTIYVACGISGGTGAGCLIDALALLRMVFPEEEHEIIVLGVLPGVAFDQQLSLKKELMITRANAIGVLSEIQAIKQGHATPMEFVFDRNTKHTVTDGANFPNSFFLIDNKFGNGTQVDTILELTKAVGTFIYMMVGSGMGGTAASRRVNNGEVDPIDMHTEYPKIFSALGIGFIEFPVQEIRGFAFRRAMNNWLERWLATVDDDAGKSKGVSVITKLNLGKLLDVDKGIGLSTDFIEDAAFLLASRQSLTNLKVFDDEFFEKTALKIENFSRDMPAHRKKIDKRLLEKNSANIKTLDEEFAVIYSKGLPATIDFLTILNQRVSALTKDLEGEPQRLLNKKKELAGLKTALAGDIKRKNIRSDKAERNLYLSALTEEMELLLVEAYLPQRHDYVSKIELWVSDHLQDAKNLKTKLENLCKQTAKELKETINRSYTAGIGTSTLAPEEYEAWCDSVAKHIQITLDPKDLSEEGIVRQVCGAYRAVINNKIRAENLTTVVAENDVKMQRMIAGLTRASMPLMQRIQGAPDTEGISPQAFIAGCFKKEEAANQKFVEKHFQALRWDKPAIIDLEENTHLLVCAQTFGPFGAAYWEQFEISEQYYRSTRDMPWYCGTFPVGVSTPPLRSLSKDVHINFGLGLATGMIDQRGSNYYLNFEKVDAAADDPRYRFATYRKERSTIGRALLENTLFQEARESKKTPTPTQRLGESITAALAALGHNADARFIREIFEDLATRKIGNKVAKQMLLEWVNTELVPTISKATERREQLDSIAEELERYAESLD